MLLRIQAVVGIAIAAAAVVGMICFASTAEASIKPNNNNSGGGGGGELLKTVNLKLSRSYNSRDHYNEKNEQYQQYLQNIKISDLLFRKNYFNDNNNDEIDRVHEKYAQEFSEIQSRIVKGSVDYPVHVHLALTNTPTAMAVTWMTQQVANTHCLYGTVPGKYSSMTTGKSHSYWMPVGIIHDAIMTDLVPGTRYYYRCGDHSTGVFSPEFTFVAAPKTGVAANEQQQRAEEGANRGYTFAVLGDMGVTASDGVRTLLAQLVHKNEIDAVLHVGDISYSDASPIDEYEIWWNEWFFDIENVSAYVPYMVQVGNHEYPYNFLVYEQRFYMPGKQTLIPNKEHYTGTNLWYSFDYGNIHFVALSTEHPFGPGSPQYVWLARDLQAANAKRATTPWIIALAHRPLYCSSTWPDCKVNGYAQNLIDAWSPLFDEFKVDLMLQGHIHGYERMWPVYNNTVVQRDYERPAATVYVNPAGGGNLEGFFKWIKEQPDWSVRRINEWGVGLLRVVSDTQITWDYLAVNGTSLDSFVMTR